MCVMCLHCLTVYIVYREILVVQKIADFTPNRVLFFIFILSEF